MQAEKFAMVRQLLDDVQVRGLMCEAIDQREAGTILLAAAVGRGLDIDMDDVFEGLSQIADQHPDLPSALRPISSHTGPCPHCVTAATSLPRSCC